MTDRYDNLDSHRASAWRTRSTRMLVLTFMACIPFAAIAVNPTLPRPHITGPAQVNNRAPLTLRFSYTPVHWTNKSYWDLAYWVQYWHCDPGKDSAPTPTGLITEPWPGQHNPCSRDDNRWGGLTGKMTGESIRVPKYGGIPATGTWYVRVRLAWRPNQVQYQKNGTELGPWSAWHRVAVVQSFKNVALPPKILAPPANHLFINQDVDVQVAAGRKRPDPQRWDFAFEWQRADYHTKANNQYADPHPGPNAFPRVLGQSSPYKPWSAPPSAHTLAEHPTPSTLHLGFADLRPHRNDSSYLYRFRVREQLRGTKAYGPWSPWRSFIVSEPIRVRIMHLPKLHAKQH